MATDQGRINPTTIVPPIFISALTLRSLLTHKSLIKHLEATLPTLSTAIQCPVRHAHQTSASSSLLLMPSWSQSPSFPYIGVKLVTYHPNNSTLNLPGVNASYVLFNSHTGLTLASLDATELTVYRTSCISALASQYLSREDSNTLVMIGAGSLAPHLIRAHLAVRPSLKRVIVWNRTVEKARILVETMGKEDGFKGISFESKACMEEAVQGGDIVSCAQKRKLRSHSNSSSPKQETDFAAMASIPCSEISNSILCKNRAISFVGLSSFPFQEPRVRSVEYFGRARGLLPNLLKKGSSPFLTKRIYGLVPKKVTTIPRSNISSNSGGSEDNSSKQEKVPFGYTRKDVLLIGVGVTVAGIALKSGLEFVGVDPLQAGNVVQLVLVLGLTVGWISTYIFRVSNKEMTYAQQLRDYESKVMEKRLESLTEAELAALLEQVEEEKRRLASGEQAK